MTPHRWPKQRNPRLVALLDEVTGSGAWAHDLMGLSKFTEADTDKVLERLGEIKHADKVDFAVWVEERESVETDPDATLGVQIKRLHECKHRLLSTFYVLNLYSHTKDDPTLDTPNHVLISGAKAALGYACARAIIKLINVIAELVNSDTDINGRIKVAFAHNYNVPPIEHIAPAADISEQISMAGKEASGVSNVKFMMNGTLTLGTLGSANVEILGAMGDKDACTFGATDDKLPGLYRHYDPRRHCENVPGLKCVIDTLISGTPDDSSSGWFHDVRHSILESDYDPADVCYVLGGSVSYCEAKDRMTVDYRNQKAWNACVWMNASRSGCFSSDRTTSDYTCEVWHIESESIA